MLEARTGKGELIAKSIFMTHARRLGLPRTAIGGGLMYLSVAEFVFIHLTTIVVLYQWMFRPLFGSRRFAIRDYVLLDRGRIERMRRFDRFNCQFCAYANGTAKLWNDQLDAMAETELDRARPLRTALLALYSAALALFLAFIFVFSKLLYRIIALFLGLAWSSSAETFRRLEAEDYAGAHRGPLKGLLRLAKLYASTLLTNLEQIESGWCPLKHAEQAGMVTPEHHENFYPQDRLDEAIERLAREGSVSPRKPKPKR